MEIKNIGNIMNKALSQGSTTGEAGGRANAPQAQSNIGDEAQKSLKDQIEKLDAKQLENIFGDFKEKFDLLNKYLSIKIDKDLNRPIVRIINKESGEVIRQFPPEQLVELAKKIDQMVGLLFEKEA